MDPLSKLGLAIKSLQLKKQASSVWERDSFFFNGILASLSLHILLVVLIISLDITGLAQELFENTSSLEETETEQRRLLVELQDTEEEADKSIESEIISSSTLEGSGSIAPSPDEKTHIAGELIPPGAPVSGETATSAPALPEIPPELLTQSQEEGLKLPPPLDLSPAPETNLPTNLTRLEENERNGPPLPEGGLSGLESENTTNFRFHIDDSKLRQPNIAFDPDAEFYIDIKRALTYKMQLFASSPNGAGAINYYYLKVDQVHAIFTIDRAGNMHFFRSMQLSQKQPYMNYLIERITSTEGAIQHLPEWFLESDADVIPMEIVLSYEGAPLYQWWVSLDVVDAARWKRLN